MSHIIPEPDGWNIVVLGHWNRAIFNPPWIIGRLTGQENIQMSFPALAPEPHILWTFEDLNLSVFSNRLQVSLKHPTDDLFHRAREVVRIVLNDLQHTPVSAVGFNLRFICASPEGKLVDAFTTKDLAHVTGTGFEVKATSINRVLRRGDRVVNANFDLSDDGKATLDFNYHFPAPKSAQALAALENDPVQLKAEALEFLQTAYEATL